MVEYGFALAGMLALALLAKRWEVMLSAMVVAGVWAAWCLFILATGVYEPWYWGIFIDATAIGLLLRAPSCRIRAVIAALYTTQVGAHVAYGGVLIWTGAADWQSYYTQTQITGWAQLLIVGGWGGGLVLRRIMSDRRGSHLQRHIAHSRDLGAGA